jgi:subtilisin-like proprotein convertase family protein
MVSSSGVSSTATGSDAFTIEDVQITLDVTHEDIAQLRVELESPGGTIVVLHDHTDDGTANLATTYDELSFPDGPGSMSDFDGEPVSGTWTLRVVDDVGGPQAAGTLNSWSLDFVATTAYACTPFVCGEPLPPAVGGSLLLAPSGTDDIAFSWAPVSGVASYRVWRSGSPTMDDAALVGQQAATSLVEAGGLIDPAPIVFYQARSVNVCEWEGP